MRKFFLFVLPALLCAQVTQASTALWSSAFSAADFDSTNSQLTVINPEKICEASELRLQPNFFEAGNVYTWITPAGKQIKGAELIISKVALSDAGTYTLKVSSAEKEQTVTTKIKILPLPAANIKASATACEGSVYALQALGNSNTHFEWSTPTGNTIEADLVNIAKLKLSDAGEYILKATNSGCTYTVSHHLLVKPTPSVAFTGELVVCESSKINLKTNADSGVKYTWWKGQNAVQQSPEFIIQKATYNHAGKYLLQAKSNGCVNSAYFNIDVRPSFNTGIEAKTELCSGENLIMRATDAGQGAVYNWSGPNFSAAQKEASIASVTPAHSGSYTVTVTKNGCSLNTSVLISVKQKNEVKISGNTSLCENETMSLSAGKEGLYTWILPNGTKQNGSVFSINKVSKGDAGIYKLISDAGFCSDSNEVAVKVHSVPKAAITGIKEVCEGTELSFYAENATEKSMWTFADHSIYTGVRVAVRSTVSLNGILKLTVTNTEGCTANDSVLVVVKPLPVINISGALEVCRFSPSYTLHAKETNNMKGFGSFAGDIISAGGLVSTFKEGVFPIQYLFTAKNGCTAVKNEIIRVKKGIEVNAGADLIRKGDEPVQINAIASENYTKLEWTNMPGAEINKLRPIVKPDHTTTYKITVTNTAGCSASDEVTVKVMKIKLANAFSPNGDGINDQFSFEGLREYPNAQIQIYNGVGKQVFTAKGSTNAWDGRCNGIPVESGTYYYNINLNDGKQNAPLQGWIQLKR